MFPSKSSKFYLLRDNFVNLFCKAIMLLAQKLLKILKAIDSAVEAYFVDEVIDYFDLMDLLLQL